MIKMMSSMKGTTFTVDAFSFGKIPNITAYFLSHFHSDHYGGLTKSFSHGLIYCSSVTANLVIGQLKVDEMYIRRLPLNEEVEIEGVKVTLIDANQLSIIYFSPFIHQSFG